MFTGVPHGDYTLHLAPPDPSRYLPTVDTPATSGDSITRIDLVVEPRAVREPHARPSTHPHPAPSRPSVLARALPRVT